MSTAVTLRDAWACQRAGNLPEAERICRQVLAANPVEAEAWHLLGVIAYQVGQLEPAAKCIRRAIELQPRPQYFSNLGLTLGAARKFDEAAAVLQQVLASNPNFAEAHNNLGNVLKESGQPAAALKHYQEALRLKPDYLHARSNLGNSLNDLGRTDEAIACYRECLAANPNFAEGHNNLGNALRDKQQFAEAVAAYERAIALRPNYAEAYSNLGVALDSLGRGEDAVRTMQKALALQPNFAVAYNNLGSALRTLGRLDEAEQACRDALRLDPNFPDAMSNLATVLDSQGKLEEAVPLLRRAIELRPNFVEAYTNLSNVLRSLGQLEESAAACQAALRIRPGYKEAMSNLGLVHTAAGQLDDAVAEYDQALAIDPKFADAHWNRALALLTAGNFDEGWKEYEWRWQRTGAKPRAMTRPQWDGSPLNGRTILLHAEQGIGDTLQFLRFMPLVKARGGRVLLECQQSLVRLIRDFGGIDQLIPRGDDFPPHDVHCPLLSLPLAFHTQLETIPADVPYLQAEPDLVATWQQELQSIPGFKIGIVWQGSRGYKGDRFRSIPLAEFEPLAKVPGVKLVSLQKGDGQEQLAEHGARLGIVDWTDRLDEHAGPFLDTAALMKCLDLIITSDTASAHLAGALGVRTWVALGAAPDWRWLLGRDDSPWYPTMRLFRQRRLGQWPEVFERIAAELGKLAGSK